jgi:hypothetical protein
MTAELITEFKLSHGTPCASSSELNWIRYYHDEEDQNYHCKTEIEGSTESKRYDKVNDDKGINIGYLYENNDLYDSGKYSQYDNEYIDLYVRNYNEIDEKCVTKFLEDFEKDKKYFDSAYKVSRILSLIGIGFIIALFIYILTTCQCCCSLNFHGIAMVAPIYGIAANIVIVGIINKPKIEYECQIEGNNKKVGDALIDAYGKNTTGIVFSVLSIVFFGLQLLFTLCLTFMRNKGMINAVPIATPGLSAFPGVYPQPAFPSVGYQNQYGHNIPYQNVMQGSVREKVKNNGIV